MKNCTKCKQTLHLDNFYKSNKYKDGLRRWCKECEFIHHETWVNKNKEKYLLNL